ncbi:triphosphoribosyl-dephospho-CoA synthase MdcB [Acuticoccus sediminis]|uniref:triphosphoribosyl-dephospho-CoA synthase MdcB n=1 Tax=Acuticoccus sediminis TaxID=2184697 RepID=UPI001CFD3DFE|nr:triphosphoribosyl-dephospho-CoA synthase MdcB [Acuticoccus sediminis]
MRAAALRLTALPRPAPAFGLPVPQTVEDRIGAHAVTALRRELDTWPKPGLVSPLDAGSHDDMTHATFLASIDAIGPAFSQLAVAGADGAPMGDLRAIGIGAERAMMAATGGVNTHRGAIFALGLLCAAAGVVLAKGANGRPLRPTPGALTRLVAERWGADIEGGPIPVASHGSTALRRYGAGGARAEAAAGFPSARRVGLPALLAARTVRCGERASHVHAFFALLATVEDTNLLHRGGLEGRDVARTAATRFLAEGGALRIGWQDRALSVHRDFVRRKLSPGGSADLLSVTLFLDSIGAL